MPKDMTQAAQSNSKFVLFEEIDGDFALLSSAGTYLQAPLFHRAGALFAKAGAGFVRLKAHGQTSKKSVFWSELMTQKTWSQDFTGLVLSKGDL